MIDNIISKYRLKDGREVIFRYPNFGDLRQMTNYINALSKEKTFILFQGKRISLKHETEYLKNILQRIKKGLAIQILAFCDSKLIGISDISMKEEAVKHEGVFGITIAKDFRNLGIGKFIMELVLDEAKKRLPHLEIITLSVFGDNLLAQKLYKSMGFKKFGVVPKGVQHKNHYDDHVFMYKRVR